MTFVNRNRAGNRWDHDPEYVANRATLRDQRRPCARCGGPIDYDGPYWIKLPNGRKQLNRRAFVAGHIISRAAGGSNALFNLQPEHAWCSVSSGAREGAQRLNARRNGTTPPTTRQHISRPWR